MGGIALDGVDPGKTGSGTWVDSSYGDFSFLTGVAYVEQVRFSDGTVWKADRAPVLEKLKTIEKDFDAKVLDEKPSKS